MLLIVLRVYLTLNSATAAETRAQEGKAEANPNPYPNTNRNPNPNFTSSGSARVYEKFMEDLIVDPRSSVYTMASRNAAGPVLSPSAGLSVPQGGYIIFAFSCPHAAEGLYSTPDNIYTPNPQLCSPEWEPGE